MRALLLLLALAGCDATDPFRAEGKWRPAGVNELNLRVMLADPSHLDQGVEEPRRDGQLAAAAVDRLRRDRVRPLPASSLAEIRANDGGSGQQGQPQGGAGGGR
jgi:hypothetical protein